MKNRWGLFGILYFAALIIAISQHKIVPILLDLGNIMSVSLTDVSWLMSVFTFTGVILALPGGALMAKIGAKKLLLLLMACLFAGNIIGAFSLSSYPMMLLSRTLEGISFSMIIMAVVVLVNKWFSVDNKVGTAMGIVTTFVAIGPVIALNTVRPITNMFGTSSVWLIIAGLAAVAFLLIAVLFSDDTEETAGDSVPWSEGLGVAFSSGRTWMLGISQAGMAFVLVAFSTLWPTMFTTYYHIDETTANFYGSLCGLMGIPMCPLAGVLVDKFHNKISQMASVSFILMGIVCLFTATLTPATYIIHPLGIGALTAITSTGSITLAPKVAKKPSYVGFTVAVVNFVYYIGVFTAPPVVAGAVENGSWHLAGMITAGACLAGAIAMIIFPILHKKAQAV